LGGPSTFYFKIRSGLGVQSGTVRSGPGVQSGPRSRTVHVPVRSTGRHGTGRHGPFSGEGRTEPPLDRTVSGPQSDHGPVWSGPRSRSGPGRVGPYGQFQISSANICSLILNPLCKIIYPLLIEPSNLAMFQENTTESTKITPHKIYSQSAVCREECNSEASERRTNENITRGIVCCSNCHSGLWCDFVSVPSWEMKRRSVFVLQKL
jgi:hypothetical protein